MNKFTSIATCAAVALLACASAAVAKDVKPGTDVALSAGDGLLVLPIENEFGVSTVRLERDGMLGTSVGVKDLVEGRNLRVITLPAGNYRFASSALLPGLVPGHDHGLTVAFPEDDTMRFTIEAGKLNYAGHLRIEASHLRRYFDRKSFHYATQRTDRALQARFALDQEFPGLAAHYAWHNATPAHDGFDAFLAREAPKLDVVKTVHAAVADATTLRERKPPADVAALAAELFARPEVARVSLSPDAARLAVQERRGDTLLLSVIDIDSDQTQVLYRGVESIDSVAWLGPRLLALTLDSGDTGQLSVFELPADAKAANGVRMTKVKGNTWFIAALRDDEHGVLVGHAEDDGRAHYFRVRLDGTEFDAHQLDEGKRLDRELDDLVDLAADAKGELRAALVRDDKGYRLKLRAAGTKEWKDGRTFAATDSIRLLNVAADGRSVTALTDAERGQVQLVRIGLERGEIDATLLAVPDADLTDVLLRPYDGAVIGATYERGGITEVRYVESESGALAARFAQLLPGQQVQLIDGRIDARALVFAQSETNPGSYYLYDAPKKQLQKLLDARPEFHAAKLRASERYSVDVGDGVKLDAFVTLPAGATPQSRAPLVVMPHGGPFGISDTLEFDPEVQFLVNRGYAVLRVNYRGSGGAGRQFEEAGFGNWGKGIEDDVLHALDGALEKYPVDRNRVALLGGSYGGYSALMGLVRTPDRYRCGVAIAAPTDLPLMFGSSDWWPNASANAHMRKVIGDPDQNAAALEAVSPLYQYAKLTRPVLLIHGIDDTRVNYEHALRLRVLLAAAGHPPQLLTLPGMGHAYTAPAQRAQVFATSAGFLETCLAAGP